MSDHDCALIGWQRCAEAFQLVCTSQHGTIVAQTTRIAELEKLGENMSQFKCEVCGKDSADGFVIYRTSPKGTPFAGVCNEHRTFTVTLTDEECKEILLRQPYYEMRPYDVIRAAYAAGVAAASVRIAELERALVAADDMRLECDPTYHNPWHEYVLAYDAARDATKDKP